MTLEEAFEYVDQAEQSESEQRAEYGSGAVSLGYDPYEWMPMYDGYRTSDDPQYAEAKRIIAENYTPLPTADPRALVDTDDIPF